MSTGTRLRRVLVAAVVALAVLGVGHAPTAVAQDGGGDYCLDDDPPPPDGGTNPLRFGITPLTAGSAGAAQLEPVPHDPDEDLQAVRDLRAPGKELVMRMNRMFWADGREGIEHYAGIVDRYAQAGFTSELQVRYHPPEGKEGDMDAWEAYVRQAARILGSREAVVGLSITNEANFSASPNTSDGSYEGVKEAIVVGTVAAREELDEMGRHDVDLGFSFAWRWHPQSDKEFWEDLGELATPEFLAATDYVGLQIYPHLVWPPTKFPDRSAGEEVVEALHLLRNCYMPKAGLGDVDLWITENGYITNLGRTEEEQERKLVDTIEHVQRWSGTLGVTDYRWFNLRDNNTNGPDMFDAAGLMRDDYTKKPAFPVFRELMAAYATNRSSTPAAGAKGPARTAGGSDASGARESATSPEDDVAADGSLPATGGGVALVASGLLAVAAAAAWKRG